jgi:FKBP-type peptidyl-prolyl cis-trans isomerase
MRLLYVGMMALLLASCAAAPRGPFADPLAIAYAPALGVNLDTATRLDGGIYIQDTAAGNGAVANTRSTVQLHYTLYLPDGRVVQTTAGSDPLEVRLDNREFLIRNAVAGMRVGGRRTIVVPPERGYGRNGLPGMVPPDATIIFHVELLAVR